jgi:transcriptional regulator with XRE-family HTH domain
MKREELINSREYWLSKIQIELFNEVENYMKKNKLTRTSLAEKFGVSKGYISQILNGEADHRISKLVELSLGIGLAPVISFQNLQEFSKNDLIKSILEQKSKSQYNQDFLNYIHNLHSINKEGLEEEYNKLSCDCDNQKTCIVDVAS